MLIVIVGVGALGSHVAQFLRGYSANITIVDGDRIEQKNVASQFHALPAVGKTKVKGLADTMNFLFKKQFYATVPHFVTPSNADTLLDATLVIDCLDNAAARNLVKEVCKDHNVPCLHGALGDDGTYGRVLWDENFTSDGVIAGTPTCHDGDHLPFIAMVSAYVARAAQEFLITGRKLNWQVFSVGGAKLL